MTGSRLKPAFFVGLFLGVLAATLQGVQGEEQLDPAPAVPEDLCRPYIEKALKDLGTGSLEQTSAEVVTDENGGSREEGEQPSQEKDDEGTASEQQEDEKSAENETDDEIKTDDESVEATETEEVTGDSQEQAESAEVPAEGDEGSVEDAAESVEVQEDQPEESQEKEGQSEEAGDVTEEAKDEGSDEKAEDQQDSEEGEAEAGKSDEDTHVDEEKSVEEKAEDESDEAKAADDGKSDEEKDETADDDASKMDDGTTSTEEADSKQEAESQEVEDGAEAVSGEASAEVESAKEDESHPEEGDSGETKEVSAEAEGAEGEDAEGEDADSKPETEDESAEEKPKESAEEAEEAEAPASAESQQEAASKEETEGESEEVKSRATRDVDAEPSGEETASTEAEEGEEKTEDSKEAAESTEEEEPTPEEDLIQEIEIPENLRPRDHINQLLKLDEENEEKERAIEKVADVILRELKKVYDNAIKPLETLYKYRDLSNRHFGDPEIFSKPLVLFMGPWSGGKSSIINYLLDIEYKHTSLRTGAEPSPAYFNILMHGEEEEILDGTQLAADWTFSGLQKFGQGLLDRLRGLRLNNKLLEKVNIVEIPGILEIRKQVQRLFPFNDACQWFIDRADIIFLVYDPSKLDVGPETEAILDQLKGREYQTRIILNKADQVKPEELMRVQGALIWNISPLMSSAEPPIMYSTSLWSMPYEAGAPTRLLYAQERAFLRDLRSAVDKRVEHKIASARRFAVRVRNHAKMVDCYLTTYYNHKTFFGNKKEISDKIIENPQDYHIYEGLSTLTNISRYDLPDPDVYRDFFRLNPLFDFPLLSSTCTYFRGCPINRLDVAIAYDLPELVGKYKKSVEAVLHESDTSSPSS